MTTNKRSANRHDPKQFLQHRQGSCRPRLMQPPLAQATMRPLLATTALLATLVQPAPAATPAEMFDFWVGDWQVTWTNANGRPGKARNHVSKILDGKVIEEDFEGDPAVAPRLLGRSLSVLDTGGVWRQAWADNQGGFFALTGSADGDSRYFSTGFRLVGEQLQGKRMRFYDIQADSFTWDWEGSNDGGKTWMLIWRIQYQRAPLG